MTASEIAEVLGGHRSGSGWLCRCPCPDHGQGRGDRRPSLSIADGDTALLIRCFGGCEPHDVLAELRRRGLLSDLGGGEHHQHSRPPTSPPTEPDPDAEALSIWREAAPIGSTLAARYLREHRRIDLPTWPPSLRYHPSAPYAPAGLHLPALVAAVARPTDRKVVAVQLTFLNGRTGGKASVNTARLTIGQLGHGAVRLAPAGEILGLAEGTESALSAMALTGVPTWAVLGGHRLGKVEVPQAVKEVHLFADDDEPGRLAGDKAAEKLCADRLVIIRFAPNGIDWNDFLQAESGHAKELAA